MGSAEVLWDGDGVPRPPDVNRWKMLPSLILQMWAVNILNKKALLCECKRHAARTAQPSWAQAQGGMQGGVPLLWLGEGREEYPWAREGYPCLGQGRGKGERGVPYPGWGREGYPCPE